MFHYQVGDRFVLIRDIFLIEDIGESLKELTSQISHILLRCIELIHATPRMQWFNNSILKVTSKDEPAVVRELFDESPQGGLG
jgi:hypothetical protein